MLTLARLEFSIRIIVFCSGVAAKAVDDNDMANKLTKYDTLVYDSLSEIQQMFRDRIMKGRPEGALFQLQDWGTLAEDMRKFLRVIRNLRQNVVATGFASIEKDEQSGVHYVDPGFRGSISEEVCHYFSVVGYCFKRRVLVDKESKEYGVEYEILVEGPTEVTSKPTAPLKGREKPDLADWINRIAQQ